MFIRVGEQEFAVSAAELRYTRVPNGTIAVYLTIQGERDGDLGLTLDPPPLPGRMLADLTGQVHIIASPTKPDLYEPRSVNEVAAIYVGSHESVYDSRVEWGSVDDRGIALRWTGIVDDLDVYDGSKPQQPLVIEAIASVIEEPHVRVRWIYTCANPDEHPFLDRIRPGVLSKLTSELTARGWFDGMPFTVLELVVQVETPRRSWPALPARSLADPQVIVASVPRKIVKQGDDAALQRAIEAEIATGLEKLEKQHRRGEPSVLR